MMKYQTQTWSKDRWLRLRIWVCNKYGHRKETNQYSNTSESCSRCGEKIKQHTIKVNDG